MFETNEQGEIILTGEPVKEKKSRKKKKEKEPTFLPPFFNEDFFNFLISDNGAGDASVSTTPHLLLKWKNEEYLPLYSLKIKIPTNLPYYEYNTIKTHLGSNLDIWDHLRISKRLKAEMPTYGFPFFKKLWETRNYRLLSFFHEGFVSQSIEMDFKTRMKEMIRKQFDTLMNQKPDVSIHVPTGVYRSGTPRMVQKFKWQNEWRWTQVKQQNVAWNNQPMYLTNLGFLARQSEWNNSRGIQIGLMPIKPLVCIVFKKEYYDLIKAYILANEPIPTELLEFWVDKSLEDADSIYNIRASYIRQIRNPYKKLGLEPIIKEGLVDLLFHRPELKKFRTAIEQLNWVDSILEKFTIEEKKKQGIS